MGYNSVILVCNDDVGKISDEPGRWWDSVWGALTKMRWCKPERAAFNTQAVWNQHADNVALILAGGNHATVLGSTSVTGGSHSREQDQEEILKAILRERGYVVYKRKPQEEQG